MGSGFRKHRRGRLIWLFGGWLVGAVAVVVIVSFFAEPLYLRLKVKVLARRAAASLAAGDPKSALLNAGKVLDINRNNLLATRTVVKSLDALGAPEAVQWHRRLDELAPGEPENLIAWAQGALKAGDRATADTALAKVKPADRNSAAYHAAAAGVAIAGGDAQAGESHLAEAVRLDAGNSKYKLSLAELRLKSTKPDVHDQAVQALDELRAKPETNLPALRLLIADAASHGQPLKMRELGKELDANPNANQEDRLALLAAQQRFKGPGFFANLEKLKASAVKDPNDLAELIGWMNNHNLAIVASNWLSTLPAELISKPPVNVQVAIAYYLGADWKRLKQSLESSPPDKTDFLRLAIQSRLLKQQGDENGAGATWKQALEAAKTRPAWLGALTRLAVALNWKQESEETLWALSETPACPVWALESLWDVVVKTNDTPQMFRVAKRLNQAAPNDLSVRTNFVYLALLTRNMQENLQALVDALYKDSPGKASVARIYALSLFQQGSNEEALKVMSSLPAEELQQPAGALYYCIFLAATGQFDKAQEYLPLASKEATLPEEKALLATAQEAMQVDAMSKDPNAPGKGF